MLFESLKVALAGVQPGAIHVSEAGREDDAGGEVIAGLRQRRERGQGVQCDVHPEGAGAVAPAPDAIEKLRRQRVRWHEPGVKQFRIDA